jgi:hypothetical protein
LLDSSRSAWRAGAWLTDRWTLMARLRAEPELRLDWSGLAGEVVASPRLALVVELAGGTRLRVAFEASSRDSRVHQQVWVLEGTIDITVGTERHRLREGDCFAMELDRPTMFHNPTRKRTHYAVVIASELPKRR